MERELLELFEAANKAADAASADDVSAGGPEVTRCLDALKQLKSFPVTYDVLASTQVGKKLRHLTKHPKEEIQTMASKLIKIWKDIVIEETKNKKGGNLDNKSSATSNGCVKSKTVDVKVEKSSVVETVKIEKNGSFSRSESIKVEKKTSNVDTIKIEKINHGASRSETIKAEKKVSETIKPPPKLSSMVKCNDAVRDKFREILAEALMKVSSEADASLIKEVNARDPIRVAVSVESVLFEKLGRSTGNNKSKYRSIMFNLKDSKNPDFRRKVLFGEVAPERLVDMNPEEMASDERQRKNFEIKEKALFECERGQAQEATTDQFKCGRCGQRKTTYYQLQTRSADEPMTTFVTCVNCNNHWKFC